MSDPSPWWQLYLGIIMSAIVGYNVYGLCSSYGINHDWSLIIAGAVALFNVAGFYFLLEAAIMEYEGMSIKSIYKEFFGEKK